MKKINEELFLVDYEMLLKEKEEMISKRDAEIERAREEINAIPNPNGLITDHVKEVALGEVVAEINTKYDFDSIDKKIAFVEKYIDEVVEAEPIVENPVENVEEIRIDEFCNQIV